ncbi:MAG: HEAT repeat domain-containing protein [Melioribacteraceae bacterium]|nr:HEAT repeat domain-containing protein [Melioribacteraceae bacterium]
MKSLLTTLMVLLLTASLFAGDLTSVKLKTDLTKIEANLIAGINSGNRGLMISATQLLGDIKSDKAVIPLLKILKSNNDEAARAAAALSLYKIGDARGLFAIKQATRFDDSQRVRNVCLKIYSETSRTS